MSRKKYKTEDAYRRAKEAEYQRYYASTAIYEKRHWTQADTDKLMSLSAMGMPDRMISKEIRRSIKSLQHKRTKLLREVAS